jgi:hypothetical protein
MGLEDDLLKLLNAHAKKSSVVANTIGIAFNIRESVCDVEVTGEAPLIDVRFHCVEENINSKTIIKPKDKSFVIASIINNLDNDWFISQCSEIGEVFTKIGDVEHSVTSDGISIKKGNDTLTQCFDDLFKQIALLTVPVVAVGSPSGTPANATAFNEIKNRINNILR